MNIDFARFTALKDELLLLQNSIITPPPNAWTNEQKAPIFAGTGKISFLLYGEIVFL
jgi:hypothetical protein